jgi:predicted nucleic acid-binding protein
MNTYLLESDVLIDLFKKKQNMGQVIDELSSTGDIVISVLTVSELRSGWDKNEASIFLSKLYDIAQVIPVTKEIAEYAGELRNEYGKKGQVLPTIDTLIAATCILNDYCLVTRNIRHYPMNEINLYKIKI